MLVTQKNRLRKLTHEEFKIIQNMCHISKNLYNTALYYVKNYFDCTDDYFTYNDLAGSLKDNENYKLLFAQCAQQTLKVVDRSFKSFFHTLRQRSIGNYNKSVQLPHFLKKDGLFVLIFPSQHLRIRNRKIMIPISKTYREKYRITAKSIDITVPSFVTQTNLHELRIIPKYSHFEIEYVYEKIEQKVSTNQENVLGIDVGLDNLLTCVNGQTGESFIIDGRALKCYNQYYNKQVAQYQSTINKQAIVHRTKYLQRLDEARYWYINNYFNQAVNLVIKYCIDHQFGTIIIGENKEWKQEINIGKRNNQHFCFIPHGWLKYKLKSKCKYYGITYVTQEESYTSKCSFLDAEEMCHHDTYMGKRIKRGLFQSKSGIYLNADVNGALNIIRKSKRNILTDELCRGLMLSPKRISVMKST